MSTDAELVSTPPPSEHPMPSIAEQEQYTADAAKALGRNKKAYRADSARQNYKGTGSKAANRQIWISGPDFCIDVWFNDFDLTFGGVVSNHKHSRAPGYPGKPGRILYNGQSPEALGKAAAEALAAWTNWVPA